MSQGPLTILALSILFIACGTKKSSMLEKEKANLKDTTKGDLVSKTRNNKLIVARFFDKSMLQGIWKNDFSGDAVFEFTGDSIDFFEYSPSKKYLYLLRGSKVIIYTDKYIEPDSIKEGSLVSGYNVLKLENDTMVLDQYNSPITYYKIKRRVKVN
jgi:hypothetical protein